MLRILDGGVIIELAKQNLGLTNHDRCKYDDEFLKIMELQQPERLLGTFMAQLL